MKVIIVHPDLGIGGAERLIVDAAVALKEGENDVIIYTSHHDANHCFPETKSTGEKWERMCVIFNRFLFIFVFF